MTNPIVEKVDKWILSIAVKKAVYFLVKMVIGFIGSVKIAPVLTQLGVSVDPATLTTGLTALIGSGLTMIQNWIKVKYNVSWL